jgi:MoxR-like ATPase
MEDPVFELKTDLTDLSKAVADIKKEISKIIIGQEKVQDLLIAAILCNGHVLIEGVPGLAKTLIAKILSKTLKTGFSRIQFTPDMMPSDVIGTSVFNSKTTEFEFRQGPVFSNIVLIDEINRAPAKTQSALFEVMEERQITVDGKTYKMDPPFMVLATQNPIEQEGTYRLPEAQLDRFLFKVNIEYPTLEEEEKILISHHNLEDNRDLGIINPVIDGTGIAEIQKKVRNIFIDNNLIKYIAQVINLTRNHGSLFLGGSPRSSIAIMNGAKAFAAMAGRDFVIPEDIKEVAPAVLKHRIILTPEREMEGLTPADIVNQIIHSVEIPR